MQAKNKLAAVAGLLVAGSLTAAVPKFEGMILRGYKDPIGIVTACAGHTKTAILGRAYSLAECETLLQEDLAEHAVGVLKCTPALYDKTGPLSGAISFAFNIGVHRYCNTTTARRFNAGDIKGGCKAMNENDAGGEQWVYAQHPDGTMLRLPGLVTRRASERKMCETEKWT